MAKYNLLLMFAWLLALPAVVIRLVKHKDTIQTLRQRFAFGFTSRPTRKTIWCHAASVGEFNTLETLIPAIEEAFPNNDIVISVSNIIAYDQAKTWAAPHLHITISPLDFKSVVRRFMRHWSPIAVLTIENEIFPNRISLAKKHGLRVIWLNARISDRSMRFWSQNQNLTNDIMENIDYVFAQDQIAFDRFKTLGVPDDHLQKTENLKKFRTAAPVTHPDLAHIISVFPYHQTLCAASTHPGEDQVILDAFQAAYKSDPSLKLILVPRHPKRAPEITSLIQKTGLSFTTRSHGEQPREDAQIYLADTMGELALWYSASATTFVAGSILPIGGHTPFEPAAYGSAIMHGAYFSNFQDIYQDLDENHGAYLASDADAISDTWAKLRDSVLHLETVQNAQTVLFQNTHRDDCITAIMQKIKDVIGN